MNAKPPLPAAKAAALRRKHPKAWPVWTHLDRKMDDRVGNLTGYVAQVAGELKQARLAQVNALWGERCQRIFRMTLEAFGKRKLDPEERDLIPRVLHDLVFSEERRAAFLAAGQLGLDSATGAAWLNLRTVLDAWVDELRPPVDQRRREKIAATVASRAKHAITMRDRALAERDAAQARLDKWEVKVTHYARRGVLVIAPDGSLVLPGEEG